MTRSYRWLDRVHGLLRQSRPPQGLRLHAAAVMALLLAAGGPSPAQPAAGITGFYRQPAVSAQHLWFTSEGDLWRAPLAGGRAERITTHPGAETRAAVSPDGTQLAFVAAYEGPAEAYVMPAAGGLPRRLTWDGQGVNVWGWTPQGEVLITAPSTTGQPSTQLQAIAPKTLARRPLPVADATDGAVSADGRTLYFTRGGVGGDNARGYRGGAMPRIWRLPLDSEAEAQPLLPADIAARRPLPYAAPDGPRIAFLGDRGGATNVWSVNARGGDLRQHTRHTQWDVRDAGVHGTKLAYSLGADVHVLDLLSNADTVPPITLGGDVDHTRTRWVKRLQPFLGNVALAPNGERVVLTVRGRLATQGTGPLRRAELPVPADGRCRQAVYGHDSRWVYALCDFSGETEAWRFAADGTGAPQQLTQGAQTQRWGLWPSPDGRWLAHGDKEGRLSLTSLAGGPPYATQLIDQTTADNRPQLVWAPDSRALVLARGHARRDRNQLLLLQLPPPGSAAGTAGVLTVLTSDRYDSHNPAFTPDGRWLYFLSGRHYASSVPSPWGDRNFGPVFDRRTKVYALALQPGLRFPFRPRDELDPSPPTPTSPGAVTASVSAGAASAAVTVTPPAPPPASASAPGPAARPPLVVQGLPARLHEAPVPPGNYTALRVDDKRMYLLEADSTPERRASLRTVAIDNTGTPPETISADVRAFDLTPDGKKLLIVRSHPTDVTGDILLVDAGPRLPAELARSQVRWTDWPIAVDPRAEWKQMFDDAWRLQRDHLFDARMRGVDWAAVKAQHAPLVERVHDRAELNEVLAQMASVLGVMHSQVLPGDLRSGPDDIAAATLAARTTRVPSGFRIDRIYRDDPEQPSEAGPLPAASLPPDTAAGPQEGDVITAINGRRTADVADLGELLRGQAGRQVLLHYQVQGQGAERPAIVLPVNAQRERQLRTADWERGNARRVDERSGGRVGYLRLPAMSTADINTFAREFYAQVDREGLIIDVRGNGGGSIDSWIIEKLLRRNWAWWKTRSPADSPPYGNMQQTFRGALVVLVDQNTYSDGETFAEGVQRLKLGTLIGKRTFGAGVWLSDQNRLADNGMLRAAESAQFAPDGTWLVEGRGVTPDIEVERLPRAGFNGTDAQLDAAIAHLQRQLPAQPGPGVQLPSAFPPVQQR